MRRSLLALFIAFAIALLPLAGQAQTKTQPPAGTPPAAEAPAPAPAPAPVTTVRNDDLARTLAVTFGAVAGIALASIISANMISTPALATLGQGVVVFTGTVVGGLAGNWFINSGQAAAVR